MKPHGFDISDEYATAIGHAVTRWGRFESDLDDYLLLLRMNDAARNLEPVMPTSFKKRASLFKRTFAYCFVGVPSLPEKMRDVIDRAVLLSQQRNRILHSWSFDRSPHTQGREGLRLHIWERGTRNVYSAMLQEIDGLSDDVRTMHGTFLVMLAPMRGGGIRWGDETFQTRAETEALENFWQTYLEGRPSPIPSRDVPPPPTFRQ